jgi:hypothetical protein
VFAGTLAYYFSHRRRLLRFFGCAKTRKIRLYLSNLDILFGGAIDPAGQRRAGGIEVADSEADDRARPGSTRPASWTACCSIHSPSVCAIPSSRPSHPPCGSPTCSSGPCSPPPAESANPCDFALMAMLGLLGLRIFEATTVDLGDLGEEHGHWVPRVCGNGTKIVLVRRAS